MASKKIYSPPVLDKIDEIEDWLREIEIWQCVTDIEEKKQGPVVHLSLPDKIRKSCNDISVSDLNKDNGLNTLITKIKTIYTKDINALAYMAYYQFENFKRPDEMTIVDYINEFERSNNKIRQFEMVLPTGVLAYKVLNNANISSEKKQLIRATVVSLTCENMKKQLKAIYDSSANSSANELVDVKSEPMSYANRHEFVNETPKDSRNFINSSNSRIFSNTRNRNRYAKQSNSTSENYHKFGQKTNPLDKSGRISRCVICKSIYHWANDCPNKVQDTSDDVIIQYYSL